jgi:hypothetical protein
VGEGEGEGEVEGEGDGGEGDEENDDSGLFYDSDSGISSLYEAIGGGGGGVKGRQGGEESTGVARLKSLLSGWGIDRHLQHLFITSPSGETSLQPDSGESCEILPFANLVPSDVTDPHELVVVVGEILAQKQEHLSLKLALFTSDQDGLEVADELLTVGQLELDLEQLEAEVLLLLSENLPDHDDQLVGIGHVRGDQVGEGKDLTRFSRVRLQRSFTGGGGDEEMLQVSINSPTGEQALQSRNPRALFTSLAPFDSSPSSTYGFVQTRDTTVTVVEQSTVIILLIPLPTITLTLNLTTHCKSFFPGFHRFPLILVFYP